MSSYAPLYVIKVCTDPARSREDDIIILGEQSNQEAGFIRNAMSVGAFLAKKSDKERCDYG